MKVSYGPSTPLRVRLQVKNYTGLRKRVVSGLIDQKRVLGYTRVFLIQSFQDRYQKIFMFLLHNAQGLP